MGCYYCHICGTYGDSDDGCETDKNGDSCHEECLEGIDDKTKLRPKQRTND